MINSSGTFPVYIVKPGSMLSASLHEKHFAKPLNVENMRGAALMFSRVLSSLCKCRQIFIEPRYLYKTESCGKWIPCTGHFYEQKSFEITYAVWRLMRPAMRARLKNARAKRSCMP